MKPNNTEIEEIRLFHSLFILNKCVNTINETWECLKNIGITNQNIIYNLIIMEYVNFEEEYKLFFIPKNFSKFQNRISDIKKIIKPIFKIINRWDFNNFRNNIIAHTWRKNGKFANPDDTQYNIPRNEFEFTLFVHCIKYIISLIILEFKNEYSQANNYMTSISSIKQRNLDYSNINSELYLMAKDVNEKCLNLGKLYNLEIILYDFQ